MIGQFGKADQPFRLINPRSDLDVVQVGTVGDGEASRGARIDREEYLHWAIPQIPATTMVADKMI